MGEEWHTPDQTPIFLYKEDRSVYKPMHLIQPSATSPPFFDNLHFEHFDKVPITNEVFVEMFEVAIVEKRGTSCRRLI